MVIAWLLASFQRDKPAASRAAPLIRDASTALRRCSKMSALAATAPPSRRLAAPMEDVPMRQAFVPIVAGAVFLGAASTAAARPSNITMAGSDVINCNGHTHIVYTPTWLAPNGKMANVMIMDRDHDNFTPLKLTVNSITETSGAGCARSGDFSFPSTAATNPVGGTVTTVVQVLAAQCKGSRTPRIYDINVTCEHDGSNATGTGIAPAIGTLDLTVTVGGKRPGPQKPVNPAEE
jgi:hypothetical protein